MAKITLDIDEKNLSTVLNILKNLKTGLIKNISQDEIKAVSSSLNNSSDKKYLSKDAYKRKLNQKVLEDVFLPKVSSTNKYLSAEEFKKRLKNNF